MAKIENIKLICFDLDGTLVDSVPDLRLALNAMLDEFQLSHCHDQQIKTWVGNGLLKLVERALVHADNQIVTQSDAFNCFEKHYQHYLNSASCLYPDVAHTLKTLKSRGYRTALITNKAERFLPELLKYFNIEEHFDLVIGGDTLTKNKPDPMPVNFALEHFSVDKSQAVMVGDSKNDILAGQNAGLLSIALTYGYNYGEPVSLLNPDYIIDQFNELLTLL
ncbi:phosphoglycolate phosphatase [Psychromonas hadalis]|uniref:phosphoglycolate phosphatase n=1 Tax=Psychromonas hadalis TaxID=211669 RepID=UPI0003B513B4|nr:phosphoglycolate phosphatase [Psychromonas hadalis]